MCDPVTLTVLAVTAGVVTAGSQVYAGQAEANQQNYQAKIADRNAALEQQNITDANTRRNIDQMRLFRRVGQQLGEARASGASHGLDLNFGSIADYQTDTMQVGFEDSNILNTNYDKEVKGYDINAANYRSEAQADRYKAKTAKTGSYLAAAGTLLATASQVGKINAPAPKAR